MTTVVSWRFLTSRAITSGPPAELGNSVSLLMMAPHAPRSLAAGIESPP